MPWIVYISKATSPIPQRKRNQSYSLRQVRSDRENSLRNILQRRPDRDEHLKNVTSPASIVRGGPGGFQIYFAIHGFSKSQLPGEVTVRPFHKGGLDREL